MVNGPYRVFGPNKFAYSMKKIIFGRTVPNSESGRFMRVSPQRPEPYIKTIPLNEGAIVKTDLYSDDPFIALSDVGELILKFFETDDFGELVITHQPGNADSMHQYSIYFSTEVFDIDLECSRYKPKNNPKEKFPEGFWFTIQFKGRDDSRFKFLTFLLSSLGRDPLMGLDWVGVEDEQGLNEIDLKNEWRGDLRSGLKPFIRGSEIQGFYLDPTSADLLLDEVVRNVEQEHLVKAGLLGKRLLKLVAKESGGPGVAKIEAPKETIRVNPPQGQYAKMLEQAAYDNCVSSTCIKCGKEITADKGSYCDKCYLDLSSQVEGLKRYSPQAVQQDFCLEVGYDKPSVENLVSLGKESAANGNFGDALMFLDRALELDPGNKQAEFFRKRVKHKLNRL